MCHDPRRLHGSAVEEFTEVLKFFALSADMSRRRGVAEDPPHARGNTCHPDRGWVSLAWEGEGYSMTTDGVGGVSGPNGPEGLRGPQRPDGPDGPAGLEGPASPGDIGGVDQIEKVPELAQWLEKIHQLPSEVSVPAGAIAGFDPDVSRVEDEQRIEQIIDRILEEGI